MATQIAFLVEAESCGQFLSSDAESGDAILAKNTATTRVAQRSGPYPVRPNVFLFAFCLTLIFAVDF